MKRLHFFCIGSEKISGDSFGPLVGTLLKARNYRNVIGTMEDTVDAKNLQGKLMEIPKNNVIIAFDTGLGLYFEVGSSGFVGIPFNRGWG